MKPADFDYLRGFLKQRSGLVLSNDKEYLLESRLTPLARKAGIDGIEELVSTLRSNRDSALALKVVEAMTTNESFFFRDKTPFDHFNQVMAPTMLDARGAKKQMRIWCAAASTGQEPYSLAICIKEMAAKLANWRIDIIGTDLSSDVIEKAKVGIYTQFEVQRGLPVQLMLKYFEQKGEIWQIASAIRSMVQYRILNLLDDFSSLGTFDIVFCRNVLIYFDQPTKTEILNRIAKVMAPDGYLVLGAAETVVGICDKYETVPDRRGLYRLRGAEASMTASRPFATLRTGTDNRPATTSPLGASSLTPSSSTAGNGGSNALSELQKATERLAALRANSAKD